jgi:cysteine-rich repeat protein
VRSSLFFATALTLLTRTASADPFVFQLEGGIINKKDTYAEPTFDTVNFKYAYEQPVVLALPNNNGDNPADFRLRNVGKTSFEVTLTEPPSEDGPHVAMSVAYVAVEAGKWSLPDGRKVVAGFVDTTKLVHSGGGGFQLVNLPIGFFATPPLVFAQIQGLANETGKVPSQPSNPWLTTSVRKVTAANFELALDGCECTSATPAKPERVGWLAIEAGGPGSFVDSDMLPVKYETLLGALVDGWADAGSSVAFKQSYAAPPLFVARLQARTDSDGGWLRYANLGTKGVTLAVDEDRCQDTERSHSPEPAALFVFSQSFRVQDADPDKDGFASSVDNCPLDANADQSDADKDGRGDACDCGDGIVAAIEFCDDKGVDSGDGCSASCEIEAGFSCKGMPSVCAPVCGDGLVRGGEACDDGHAVTGDGCGGCVVEQGFACMGEPSLCAPVCGDGLIRGGEACDDGNGAAEDGCGACQVELGYQCAGEPSVCETVCGDGLVAGDEACDDANDVAGDGCSPTCSAEPMSGAAGGGMTGGSGGAGGAVASGSGVGGAGGGMTGGSGGVGGAPGSGAGGASGVGSAGSGGTCAGEPCGYDTLLTGRACSCSVPGEASRGERSDLAQLLGFGLVAAVVARRGRREGAPSNSASRRR